MSEILTSFFSTSMETETRRRGCSWGTLFLLAAHSISGRQRCSVQWTTTPKVHRARGQGPPANANEPRGRGPRVRRGCSVAHFPPRRGRWRPAGRKEGGGRCSRSGLCYCQRRHSRSGGCSGAQLRRRRGRRRRRRRRRRRGEVACPVSCLWLAGVVGVWVAEREGTPRSKGPVRAWLRGSLWPPRPGGACRLSGKRPGERQPPVVLGGAGSRRGGRSD